MVENLHGDVEVATNAVRALVRAALTAIPTGKQNSFAAHNLPDFVLVEVLPKNIPLSYANAFLKPVRASEERDQSLMDASIAALAAYAENVPRKFNLTAERAVFALDTRELANATTCDDLDTLVDWVAAQIPGAS